MVHRYNRMGALVANGGLKTIGLSINLSFSSLIVTTTPFGYPRFKEP